MYGSRCKTIIFLIKTFNYLTFTLIYYLSCMLLFLTIYFYLIVFFRLLAINSQQISSDEIRDNWIIQQSSEITQEALPRVLENLNSVIIKCDFKNVKKSDEIQKRFEIMRKMWQDGKLNDDIQNKMITLTESLKNDDYQSANHIQVSLMVDHVALCSSWMVGIRHLIQQVQSSQT